MFLFSNLPRGVSGAALLLLRCSVALLLASGQGRVLFTDLQPPALVLAGLVCCMAAGLLTPVTSALAAAEELVFLFSLPSADRLLGGLTVALCSSVAMLGAGAYSLDGMLFGRKRLVLPDR